MENNMNTFRIEKVVKESNEKVVFENGKEYKLLDQYDEGTGGVIIKILDKEELKKDFNNDDVFYDMNDNEVGFEDVVCSLWIKDDEGGYSLYFNSKGDVMV